MMGQAHLTPTYPIVEIRGADADDTVRLVGDFKYPGITDFLAIADTGHLGNDGFVIVASLHRAVSRGGESCVFARYRTR